MCIRNSHSHDHEQIVYDGTMTMPGLSEVAGADAQTDTVQELTTKNWDEAVAFLGYVPEMPTRIPDGWVLDEYYWQFLLLLTHQKISKFSVIQFAKWIKVC